MAVKPNDWRGAAQHSYLGRSRQGCRGNEELVKGLDVAGQMIMISLGL